MLAVIACGSTSAVPETSAPTAAVGGDGGGTPERVQVVIPADTPVLPDTPEPTDTYESPEPTVNIDATVEAGIQQGLASRVTSVPIPVPTATDTPIPPRKTPTALPYGCFVAGTPVLTPNGYVAIEELRKGDTVFSYDHNFQERVEADISAIVSRKVNDLMRVELADGTTIQVTREHPFYSPDESIYKPIGEFKPGEKLARIGRDEKLKAIGVAGVKVVRGEFTVYNISVDSSHENYVAAGVLVHNKTPNPTQPWWLPTAKAMSYYDNQWGTTGAGDGQFNNPYGIAVASDGSVYVSDLGNDRIQKFTSKGAFVSKWGTEGTGDGQFQAPGGVSVAPDGTVYVADIGNHRIQKFTSEGAFVGKWGTEGTGDGQFWWSTGIAVASDGSVYVSDTNSDRIQKFTSEGVFISKWGTVAEGDGQFSMPHGVAVSSDGSVYVSDDAIGNRSILKFTSDGLFVSKWGGTYGKGDGEFGRPNDVAVASDGSVYVSDMYHNRIQKFTSEGVFVSTGGTRGTGDGEFLSPRGIAVASDGSVYVADSGNNRIQKFSVGP